MLLSKYFLPTLKEKPADAQVASHSLMLRSGMIRQHASGIYNWLPMGLKVLQNISDIVRFNMNASGFVEMLMPCVQSAELWKKSGRFDSYGREMLKFTDRHEHELLFGPTNEEVITDLIKGSMNSYKDLPKVLYQIQWKFRDEIRPRFGVMRGREFLMKDAYSFDIDEASAMKTYDQMFIAYMRTFRDLGLFAIPLIAPTGEIGGSMSHEFHVIADTGESLLYYDKKLDLLQEELAEDIRLVKSLYAKTEEEHDPKTSPLKPEDLSVRRGIEVGHIFNFGDKYSKPLGAFVTNQDGMRIPIQMGSYGIGVSRLAAAIIEVSHDDRGIIWPISVAPFKVSVVNLNVKDEASTMLANNIYSQLLDKDIDVLYDDTDESAGAKLAIADLIGSPWQIIIGKSAKDGLVELKHRETMEKEMVTPEQALAEMISNVRVK